MTPKQIQAFNKAAEKLGKTRQKLAAVEENIDLSTIDTPASTSQKALDKIAANRLKAAVKGRNAVAALLVGYDNVIASLGGALPAKSESDAA